METTVKKDRLVSILEKNREQHQAIFQEAVTGYQKLAEERLQENIDRIRSGSLERVQVFLPAPENHVSDYDRALKMLELTDESTVTLNEKDASRLVMDDWGWRKQFIETNSPYSETASTLQST